MKKSIFDMIFSSRKTRKINFHEQFNLVVLWNALVQMNASFQLEGRAIRLPVSFAANLRTHFMLQWFTLSKFAMEGAYFDTPIQSAFPQFYVFVRLPDESTILRFCYRLEKYKFAE